MSKQKKFLSEDTIPFVKFSALLLAFIFCLAIYRYYKSSSLNEKIRVQGVLTNSNIVGDSDLSNGLEQNSSTSLKPKKSEYTPGESLKKDPPQKKIDPFDRAVEEDKKTRAHFLSEAYLEIDLPLDMLFQPLDLEEGVEGIYGQGTEGLFGVDSQNRTSLAVLGTGQNVSEKEILDFIKSGDGSVPNFNPESSGPITPEAKLQGPPGSGIADVHLYQSKDKNSGDDLKIAVMKRSDGRGTYLFVMKAPGGFIDSNEGYFERIFNGIKTKAPNK